MVNILYNIIVLEPFIFFCVMHDYVTVYDIILTSNLFFLNQQFITWDVRADHGSYFIIIYMYTKTTKRLQKKRDEKERKRTKRRREKLKCNKPNGYT